jgi:hypothetical protein
MSDAPKCQFDQVRWAVIVTLGRWWWKPRPPTPPVSRSRRRGYIVLEVNRDNSNQALSF